MSRRAPLLVGIGAGALVLLVFFALVMPRFSEVGDARDELEQAQAEEEQLRVRLVQLQELKRESVALRRELEQTQTLIPPQADLQGLIQQLQFAADRAGVDFSVLSVSAPAPSATATFSTIGLSVTATGDFYQVARFLYEVERLPRAVKVPTVTISASEYPNLTATLTAETYTLDTSAGPGSQAGPQLAGEGAVATEPAT